MERLCLGLLLVLVLVTPLRAEMTRGELLAASCLSCHGIAGARAGEIPSLGDRSGAFIIERLADYRTGARRSPTMEPIARGFSATEIEALAAWFDGLTKATTP